MDPIAYLNSSTGKAVWHPSGYWAFLPAPLPPNLHWSSSLITILAEAERNLAKLSSLLTLSPGIGLWVQPFLRKEAVFSSYIDGTPTSLLDLYISETRQSSAETSADIRMAKSYLLAVRYGKGQSDTNSINLNLIRKLHDKLFEGAGDETINAGEFRSKQNWIGPAGCSIEAAPYVPPPVDEMMTALRLLEDYMHAPANLPALVRLGFIHYQFEAIHPFMEGNGRIGRLLVSLLMVIWELLPHPCLTLSAALSVKKQEYFDRLLAVSQRGAWKEWMRFFIFSVNEQAQDVLQHFSHLQSLYSGYKTRVQSERAAGRLIHTLDVLFERPVITVRQLESALGVPFMSATRYIDRLVSMGILTEMSGQTRNRIFQAHEILHAIEGQLS